MLKAKISNIKHHITILNSLSSLALQAVTTISGLIIPRLIIYRLGSDVNGLVASLTQFLNFVTLLEGGLSAIVMASLYKPIIDNDHKKISAVLKTTQVFYRKISYIFLAYAIGVAIIYPLIVGTTFSFAYVSSLTLIIAFVIFLQYNMALPLKFLLNASKKVYLVACVQIAIVVLNTIATTVILNVYPNIHVVKIVTAMLYLAQPIAYIHFSQKYFSLEKAIASDNILLKNRWSGFGINIAAFIHYNTDVAILTLFTNLSVVSVYVVYALVTTGLRQIIQAISGGIIPSLGNAYASGDSKKLLTIFKKYELTAFILTFTLFTIGGLLITPFVALYTNGITDANYHQPALGILLILAEGVCCLREPYVNIAYVANKFKDVTKHSIIEASLNVIISIALVFKFGVVGVAIGTLISMSYRTLFHVWYTKKVMPYWRYGDFIKRLIVNIFSTAIGAIICLSIFPPNSATWLSWGMFGVIYTVIIGIATSTLNVFSSK